MARGSVFTHKANATLAAAMLAILILSGCVTTTTKSMSQTKSEQEICLQALTPITQPLGWKTGEQLRPAVAEAKRRLYTPASCAEATGRSESQDRKDGETSKPDTGSKEELNSEPETDKFQEKLRSWLERIKK